MSADSGRRGHGALHNRPAQIVSPQPVSDKSIIDSVAGIINDIVPQGYASGGPNSDNRETIAWARFEWADINDPSFFGESSNEGSSIPPLLLVLGYASGAQVWLVSASGEASEVLSWRSGPVRCLRVLPSPRCTPSSQQQQQQQQQQHQQEQQQQIRTRGHEDLYGGKRPLVALCDASGPQPHYHAVSFVSLRSGEVVKSIRFKSPVSEVLANKRSILVTFPERIAVFDARSLEDVLSVTTCYHSPGSSLNPVALGSRWMAYCERRLLPAKRSSGGCEAEGVSSYTATVLYAAKSLGKGLRGLGETVASSLGSGAGGPAAASAAAAAPGLACSEAPQPGVVSVLDLEGGSPAALVAHFAAHSEAVVAMCFDQTGALLMTADRRGHDFHVFRVQPHPGGASLAAVHHLYVLHRGDTSAKVQDMAFSGDARWAVVSTSRGTSHVFPVAPYGGPLGVRTHSSPHVVNRLSRFHKSAGLGDDSAAAVARSHSPVGAAHCHEGSSVLGGSLAAAGCLLGDPSAAGCLAGPAASQPYGNPRLPPYPHPTVVHPLAQIRQPGSLGHAAGQSLPRMQQARALPRHPSDEAAGQLKLCACFAPPRAWIHAQRDAAASKLARRAVDSLFIMACHGNLIQYDLEPRSSSGVPREKVCDDTPIELEVEAKGQWPLMRTTTSCDINAPLSPDSPLLELPLAKSLDDDQNSNETRWLSQVEIFTHAGPHRRLWMGPQFVFKTYNAPSGIPANLVEAETVEVGTASGSRPARSNPVNMPHAASRPLVPVVIDGSGSSYEQSPRFVETYGDALDRYENTSGGGENQLREDLAEAMLETATTPHRSTGRRLVVERVGGPVAKVVNPLGTVITVSAEEAAAAAAAAATRHKQQQQQAPGATPDLDTSQTSTTSSGAAKSDSVCAEEGKWSGCGCGLGLGEEPGAEAVREHTEICAEMRPTREVAAIDRVPPESIEEVRESRTVCAEALRARAQSPAWGRPRQPSSSEEERRPEAPASASLGPSSSSSSDEDIEHVLLVEAAQPRQPSARRQREPELPDMVEIIDIDAMQRALGEPEPVRESVRVVLAPPKPAKPRRGKAQQRAKLAAAAAPDDPADRRPEWGALLEANKENLEERPPREDKRAERLEPTPLPLLSSSSDEASAMLLLLPMDTEEEEAVLVARADELRQLEVDEAPPPPLPLLPSLQGATKKANRSKKKKRR